jgi:hypothetical protein
VVLVVTVNVLVAMYPENVLAVEVSAPAEEPLP